MLAAIKKGKEVNEGEMPPPVASGKTSAATPRVMHNLLVSSGDQDEVTAPEEEKKMTNNDFVADHESKDASDTELPTSLSKTSLRSSDANAAVPGVCATLENST